MAETHTPAAEIRVRGLLRVEIGGTLLDDEGFMVAGVEEPFAVLHNWGDVAEGALHWSNHPGVLYREVSEEEAEGTARRLVALWNAAERLGIPTDLVDRYLVDLVEFARFGAKHGQELRDFYRGSPAAGSPQAQAARALGERADLLLPLICQATGGQVHPAVLPPIHASTEETPA